MITVIIAILALLSYLFGLKSVFNGRYKPSVYSRIIWSLISINSLVGVIALHNNASVLVLAAVQFIGSLSMLLASLKYSVRTFGRLEIICSILLLTSLFVWLLFKQPIINVLISLIAHLLGGLPTIKSAWEKPDSEDFLFWLMFAAASLLAFIYADAASFKGYIYALYFLFFDGTLTLLSSRQFIKAKQIVK